MDSQRQNDGHKCNEAKVITDAVWHNVISIALQSSSNSMRANEAFVRDKGYRLVDISRKVNNGVK